MLAEDAAWSMPPEVGWYRGVDAITSFLETGPMRLRWRHLATHANGQVAFATYLWDPDRECYEGHVIQVLTLRGDRIAEVTAFVEPALVAQFGLPATLR